MRKYNIYIAISVLLLVACNGEQNFIPKPRMYPKINFPQKGYQQLSLDYCDFTFEYPSYAHIEKDSSFFDGQPLDDCWFDIVIPSLNGKIHCSYYPIENKKRFDELIEDSFDLASKHNRKADYRDEMLIQKSNGVSGIIFEMTGPVATPVQFFLTDSINHYFRGSLYFYNQVNQDSMAPVFDYVKDDIAKLVESFEWKT
jgi:gliding motility-associated lipoprotein GldD